MVITPRGRRLENPLQPAPQLEFVAKALNQEQAAEVGERFRFEREIQCLQAFSHVCGAQKRLLRFAPITSQNVMLLADARKSISSSKYGHVCWVHGAIGASFRFNGNGLQDRTGGFNIVQARSKKAGSGR